jgi:uncharacterized protein (DUF952 family)
VIYHIAVARDWDAALEAGEYRTSTLGRTLEHEGFVHAAFAEQVRGVADRYYPDVAEPLVLLTIDETRLDVPWRVDEAPGCGPRLPPRLRPDPGHRRRDEHPHAPPRRPAGRPHPAVTPSCRAYSFLNTYACSGVGAIPNRR